jgi:predicted lipoprotein with Yx(FWY)xxD motif
VRRRWRTRGFRRDEDLKRCAGHRRVAKTALGSILVDSQGRTLYRFKADSGSKSKCFGACAAAWPPLRISGTPTVGSSVNPSLIGTTTRSDGKAQVTYNGHPLYLYAGDQKPGDTNGQAINGFGAPWSAVSTFGNQVQGQAPPPAPATTSADS